jgi:hypothetical protein
MKSSRQGSLMQSFIADAVITPAGCVTNDDISEAAI